MDQKGFHYHNDRLWAENVPLDDIARLVDTPCYVYSRATIEQQWRAYDEAFGGRDHLVCFAVKANSNIAILNLLARLGSGFDIVSVGELERVLRAGGDPARVVFSGVGKTGAEMRRALDVGIGGFNVESLAELETLNEVAGAVGRKAPVSLRINPDVDPGTHPYISTGLKESKFGIPIEDALEVYERALTMSHVQIRGVACHIGSQLTGIEPFLDALDRILMLVGDLADAGIELESLDLGGGLGIRYSDETPPEPGDLVVALMDELQLRGSRYQRLRVTIEPGRSIVGNAGVLLSRVLYLKYGESRNFAIVDAAMNDLMRPALYDAWQDIVPVARDLDREATLYDVVGPVCESGDFLGKDRELAIDAGDLLAVASAGAYGASMSSNYNSRPLVPEVLVDGDRIHVIRRRETIEQLWATESIPGE
jgi:diaminopimelate decarboxylase